jgi:hypothetical protein
MAAFLSWASLSLKPQEQAPTIHSAGVSETLIIVVDSTAPLRVAESLTAKDNASVILKHSVAVSERVT